MKYEINLIWDDEENVWIATSRDVPGLALEAESLSSLLERLQLAIPELLALNSDKKQSKK